MASSSSGHEGLDAPLLPHAKPDRKLQRNVSFKLPTPFAEQAEGVQPPRAAGGVLRNKYGKYRDYTDQRARTSVLIAIAGVLERSNEQILPALYRYVGRSFHATPKELGLITLACALVQAIAAPVGGLLGHYYNRIHVLSAGCFIWASMAFAFSLCNTVGQGAFFWAFNGVGLGLLIPNAQSLIADYYRELSRGKAFGALYLTGALGGMLGAFFGTNLGHARPFGIDGWRFAFMCVAALSAGVGVLNLIGSVDPRFKAEDPKYQQEPDILKKHVTLPRMLSDIGSVLAVPSFVIVVLQGIVGSAPWNALVFNTLYFQLLGFSDFHASLMAALFLAGTAVGGQFGGFLGDWAAAKSPNHGRVLVAQVSVGLGVPLSVLVYKVLPIATTTPVVVLYCVVMVVWGAAISWAAPACNSPLFGEIVPAQQRTIIYSFDRAFEGAVAAMGAPLVGWLAEHLGFKTEGSPEKDLDSARALGTAMLLCTAIPWSLCALFFSGLHVTYSRDKKAALAHQRARSGFATLPVVPLDLEEEPLEVGPSLPVSVPRLVPPRTAPASRAVSRSV